MAASTGKVDVDENQPSLEEPDEPTSTPRSHRRHRDRWDKATLVGLPFLVFSLAILAWHAAIELFEIPAYLAPTPGGVLSRILTDREALWGHFLTTASEAVTGFGLAIAVGIPLGFLIASSRLLERAFYPILVVIELTPKIAFAPLLLIWFGFGFLSKLTVVFLMSFFPIMVASLQGYKALDPRLLYITRSMGATHWQTLRFVRFQSALPHVFTGLRLGVVGASVGAIVAEFIGASGGLGYILLRGATFLNTAQMFASLVLLAILGIALSYSVVIAEFLIMPWARKSNRRGE